MTGRLNFATTPFRNQRLPWLLFALAAVLLLVTTVVHGTVLTRYLLREREELDVKVQELEQELADLEVTLSRTRENLRSQKSEARSERIRFLASVYRQKNFSWTGLLNELESITPAAIRVTSISPKEKDGKTQVTLTVVGRSLEDVLEMVRRLEASRLFRTVLPVNERLDDDSKGGGVAATLTLRYDPHSTSSRGSPAGDRRPSEPSEGGGQSVQAASRRE
ncbi:MAG: PilN domain-containing protein [Acidobacteriota bacterium]